MTQPVMTFRRTYNHNVGCDLCHQGAKTIYHLKIEGMNYKFCSSIHAKQALENFNKKKENHINPTSNPIEEEVFE